MPTTIRTSGVFLACILLIWAAAFTYAAINPQDIFPTRWDFPTPFEYTVTLPGQGGTSVSKLYILLAMTYRDNQETQWISFAAPSKCDAVVNNGEQMINLTNIGNYNLHFSFGTPIVIKNLHILCHDMTALRPMPYPVVTSNTIPAQMHITVDNNSGTNPNPLYSVAKSVDILDEPALLHQYHWTHPESSEITVTFTFYRPAGCDETTFTFEDPHLQIPLLTSLALPEEEGRLDDLSKPFHLFQTPPVTCSTAPSGGQAYRAGADLNKSELVISSAPPLDRPFICTFQLTYPPDTLVAIHHQSMIPKWSITYPSGANNPVEGEIPLPYAIPDQYRKGTPPSYSGLHIWVSSYHFFSTQQLTFEFGIATTHQFIDLDSPRKMVKGQEVPNQMQLAIFVDGNSFPLSLWNPSMSCRDHINLQPFPVSITGNDIDFPPQILERFGRTCRVTLTGRPTTLTNQLLSPLQIRFMPSPSPSPSPPQYFFTLFHAFHRAVPSSPTQQDVLPLYDSTDVHLASLPPIQRFQFPSTITQDTTTGNVIYHMQMNVQYLSPRPHIDSVNTRMVLLCVFPRLRAITDLNISRSPVVTLNVTSNGYPVLSQEDLQLSALPVTIPTTIAVPHEDNEMNTFQHGRPIRAPHLAIPLPIGFDATRPLSITLSIPGENTTTVITSVYPILLPQHYADALVYSPQYARITPPRLTPLAGYFYRCVNWDQMAASYVYAGGAEQLTDINSMVCPPFPQDGETIDPEVWRKSRYSLPSGEMRCVYELAAVCVTRSKTNPDAYNVHPLADCPSFLGGIYSMSCNDPGSNDEREWNQNNEGLEADISEPELDENDVHKKRSIRLAWLYAGDPRRTLTIAIKPLLEGRENDGEDDPHGWITLARDIPASLSPHQSVKPGITIGFPILSPKVEAAIIRLTLNGAPGAGQMIRIRHTMEEAPHGNYQTGCDLNANKLFEDVTHLCKCGDDFISNGPTSVDNPLVHPSEFTCMKKPSDDVPSTSEPCHAIPVGVTPPYRTERCGYGFSTNTTGKCEDCECFSAWKLGTNDNENDGKKCERCHLKDVCHPTQTAAITFTPEYCLVKRCLCEPGYSGDQCQYAVMYGPLAYHDVATEEQKASLIDATKESPAIVPRRLITTFQPRVTNNVKASLGDTPVEIFVQQATQVLSDDGEEVITSIMVALGRLTNADASPSPSPFTMMATTSASPFTPAASGGNNDLGDLHYAWEQLQNNYQDRPVYKDDDYGTLNGGVGSAYDPHCVPNAFTYCPDGKEDDLLPPESQVDEDELKDVYEQEDPDSPIIDNGDSGSNTTTYIIIGVVLGVVLILFILLIVAILYCRKHEKMCFRQRKTKGSSSKTTSHHASSTAGLELTKASSHSSTPPSAPPSSTMSTSSYLPTQVAIADPTLPADWIALEDKSTGKIYYSNKVTMESSWDHPAQPKAKVAGAYGW